MLKPAVLAATSKPNTQDPTVSMGNKNKAHREAALQAFIGLLGVVKDLPLPWANTASQSLLNILSTLDVSKYLAEQHKLMRPQHPIDNAPKSRNFLPSKRSNAILATCGIAIQFRS